MVATDGHTFLGKSSVRRRRVDELSELLRRLPGVTAELVHLARSGLSQKDGAVFNGLLDGRSDDTGMSGTDGVNTRLPAAAIAMDDLLQSLARIFAWRFHRFARLFGPRLEQQVLVKLSRNRGFGAVHGPAILVAHIIDEMIRTIL